MSKALLLACVASLALGCADSANDAPEDPADSPFLTPDGMADGFGIGEGSPEALGVLAVVNEKTAAQLKSVVKLAQNASTNIAAHRAGADHRLGTADDDAFDTLAELDAVSYVGTTAFRTLLMFAMSHGYVHDGADVCAMHHTGTTADGDAVDICDRVYDTLPRVRPPADALMPSGTSTLYVGVRYPLMTVIDRTGKSYVMVDHTGAQITDMTAAHELPSTMRMPSHRDMYLVYRIQGTIGTFTDPYTHEHVPSIHITQGAAAIFLPASALDGAFLGEWEGSVSAPIVGSTRFDPSQRIPVRVRFASLAHADVLKVWGGSTQLRDGQLNYLVGQIENWSTPVQGSNGQCLPAIKALGADPYAGATSPTIKFHRVGGMHFPGDEVIVVEYPVGTMNLSPSGMSGLSVVSPEGLIRVAPTSADLTIDFGPHGTPNGNDLSLRPLTGAPAATACTTH